MTEYVESALRHTLTREGEALPVSDDPWPRFDQREGAHRRARRVRGVVAAGVLAAAVGIQTNVVPLPGWAPGIAVASPWSALAKTPMRGGLATDAAWLASFRRQIKGVREPEGLWKVANRDAIRVVYADDVPGHRVALVLVPLRLGLITDWHLTWYVGPAGAAAGGMEESGGTEPNEPVATWMESDASSGGVAVVVGPAGSTVTISSGWSYSPKGVVEHRQTTSSDGNGIGVAVLPPSGLAPGVTTRVTRDGKEVYAGPVYGGWAGSDDAIASQEPTDAMLAAAGQGARGPGLDRAVLASFVSVALQDSRLAAGDVTVRLRWSGTVDGQPAGLFTVQPSGGGVLAYAMHGSATSARTDLRLLLPAAGAEQRPIAWRMRAEGKDDRTDRVIVVAPAGAATVSITAAGGTAAPVALDAAGFGTTTVPPDQAATVTSFAAGGSFLSSTPVPPFENDSSGLPGDTPKTRVVG
jgi:hypothetical protein